MYSYIFTILKKCFHRTKEERVTCTIHSAYNSQITCFESVELILKGKFLLVNAHQNVLDSNMKDTQIVHHKLRVAKEPEEFLTNVLQTSSYWSPSAVSEAFSLHLSVAASLRSVEHTVELASRSLQNLCPLGLAEYNIYCPVACFSVAHFHF